jgi:hypothetical protein
VAVSNAVRPWNSIGRPIESVHVPDSVHALTKRDVPVEGASPLSVDAYNALRIVQWALLLTCLALSAICVISASYVCLIHCLMMFGAVGLIFLPLLNTPSIEGLLSQRVEALDGPGTGLILQAIGASDDVQGYVQAQITVLATRKAGPGRTVLPSNSAISIVQRAGTKFRDSGRRECQSRCCIAWSAKFSDMLPRRRRSSTSASSWPGLNTMRAAPSL